MFPRQIPLDSIRKLSGISPFSSTIDSFLSNIKKSIQRSVNSPFLGFESKPSVEDVSRFVQDDRLPSSIPEKNLTGNERSKIHSVKQAFPGVFFILDRFPMENHTASVQSLAEIGALFPDTNTLSHFQSSEVMKPYFSGMHRQLNDFPQRWVQQLSPSTALNVYKAFAILNFRPTTDVHNALVDNILNNNESFDLPDLANVQARLMLEPVLDEATFSTLSDLLTSSLLRSKKRNLKHAGSVVSVLEMFVKHDLRDDTFLSTTVEFLKARIKGLTTKELVSVVHSFTHLKYPAEKLFDAIVLEVLDRGAEAFSPTELAQLSSCLTRVQHFDVMTDVLMDSIALSSQKRKSLFRFEELVDLLWAYAHHMHFHHDSKVLECLASGLVQKIQAVNHVQPEICVKLSEVVGTSDFEPAYACQILDAVSIHLPPRIHSLSNQDLRTMLTGCRKARYVNDRLMEAIKDGIGSHAEDLTLSELSRILNNFASLDSNPGSILLHRALHKAINPDELSPTETCRLIWSLAYFNKLTVVNSRPLFKHLDNFSRSSFSALDTQKILLSEKLILLMNKGATAIAEDMEEGLIPQPLRSDLVSMWRDRMYFTRSLSPFQQEVGRVLTKLNIYHEPDALVDEGDLSVDFLIFLGSCRLHKNNADSREPESKIVLECDGPRRQSVNPPFRALGQTKTFKRLLRSQGWKVFVIEKQEWDKKTASEQESLLLSRLQIK